MVSLIPPLGNGVLDVSATQVTSVAAGAIRLVAAQVVGPSARTAAGRARYANALHYRDQLGPVASLTGCDQDGQRMPTAFARQVDLRGQPSSGTAQPLVSPMMGRPGPSARNPWRPLAGARRVLMCTAHRRIHAHHGPVDAAIGISNGQDGLHHPSHVPSADQRRCLSCTVFQLPKHSGKSRQGIPVHCRKKMPSMITQ